RFKPERERSGAGRACRRRGTCRARGTLRALRRGDQPLADRGLAGCLARAAHGLGRFAHPLLRGLLVILAQLHLTENALALKPLLEHAESLVDIVVSNKNLQSVS